MTREEALLYLPEQDGESLEDRFEQVLFEIKQSFSTKTPVSKLISNKLRRLERIEVFQKTSTGNCMQLLWKEKRFVR